MEAITTISVGKRVFKVTETAYMALSDFDRFLFVNIRDAERKNIAEQRMSDFLDLNLPPGTEIITYDLALDAINDTAEREGLNYYPGFRLSSGTKLYRDTENGILGGVCAGMGRYFKIDPVILRLLFVILTFITFGIIIYVILWIVLPPSPFTAVSGSGRRY